MAVLIINGSPRRSGATAKLLTAVAEGVKERHPVEFIHVYDLNLKPCRGCLKCRPAGACVLPPDDAPIVGNKIRKANHLVVGTPTYWGNMSGPLKILFDRNVPVFEFVDPRKGFPKPQQKGKKAVIVTASSSPWPYNLLPFQARGAIKAVAVVLQSGGYKIVGTINWPNTRKRLWLSERIQRKAKALGRRL